MPNPLTFPPTLQDKAACVICKSGALSASVLGTHLAFKCGRCGEFFVRYDNLRAGIETELQPFVGAATRQASESGIRLTLDEGYRVLANLHRDSSFSVRSSKLLEYFGKKSGRPGQSGIVIALGTDYTLADAATPNELKFYLEDLESRVLVSLQWNPSGCIGSPTPLGWQTLEPRRTIGGIPGRCFVAQSFSEDMRAAYREAIAPAIIETGYQPQSLLNFTPIEGITDRILAEVRQAEFIIADFTHNRNGVYFEAGFARGLGRPVIGTCRRSDFDQAHFDIKHLGHVLWDNHEELKQGLIDSIRANIVRPG